ncbi:2OG-Fe(II) oxygenase [Allosphingosinicella indica]|uniref:Proline 4-hydroxylase (Includes Rps23 Pro-64 3,4-dihydroxylase Tpa1), contains SM-20 domain n=1 Tax=Allosphingosinicella indica TaxID=941907 RepID=A0A1X7G1R0_9SPHN|nr:2OG-Fe(II) oxygenase family protein [Allosphingosinicella indica]SMF61823.1 Proline 4-hydroxylase (includes Rps23 Pro-64 3,4-dihydroxylase Tpa1), contains SM-20 domain [Allosphingosinicella indica]
MTQLRLNASFDPNEIAARFQTFRRLQIPNFLAPDCAEALYRELAESRAWVLTANRGEQVIDFREEMLAGFSQDDWIKLDKAVTLGGRFGFQFRYDTIRLKDGGAAQVPLLAAFTDFLCSDEIVAMFRTITGADDIGFADAHASRYRPHHFLTTHDDRIEDQGRRAAYVLNLSPGWRPDWGGLLQFYDAQGNVERGYTPAFNTLNIFSVPQPHSVTWVTPLAAQPRFAVTGWLRAGERPTA